MVSVGDCGESLPIEGETFQVELKGLVLIDATLSEHVVRLALTNS
jgi:hypothetical protein